MDAEQRAFYRFHASLMEPWDGPASIAFTDGTVIGAVLDRNGLRPSRYWVTDDDLVIMASRGRRARRRPRRGRAEGPARSPGRMFLVDTDAGPHRRRRRDQGRRSPPSTRTASGSTQGLVHLDDLPDREHVVLQPRRRCCAASRCSATRTRSCKLLIAPMARTGGEALGSMGTDTPIAVLSDRPRLLFDYFQQLFAQVTNPPLDAIREELVTSLGVARSAPRATCSSPAPESCRQIVLPFPILDNDELAKLIYIDDDGDRRRLRAVVDRRPVPGRRRRRRPARRARRRPRAR